MEVIKKLKVKPELLSPIELLAYIKELEKENKRLEELYQKSAGLIAMYPTNIKPKTNREKIMQMSVKEFYETYCKEHYEAEEKEINFGSQFSDMSAFALFVCAMLDCHNCPMFENDDYTPHRCNNLDKWLNEELKENNESCK